MKNPERYLNADPVIRPAARALYESAKNLPLVCPHGHVDPSWFAREDFHFNNPVELLIQPDHYVLRILHSQGVTYEQMGIPIKGGEPVEEDPRKIWQIFADHFYCLAATPVALWIGDELSDVFGIEEPLTAANAQEIYETIQNQLKSPEFTPRQLYRRFNIAVLSTTDSPVDDLSGHRQIAQSGWGGTILPTFRADTLLHIERPDWRQEVEKMAMLNGTTAGSYRSFIQSIEARRAWFKENGTTATDMAVLNAHSHYINHNSMENLYQKGLKKIITPDESAMFTAGMLMEMARMSSEDGLVMQLHVGCYRNHDRQLFENGGSDLGADFPVPVEFTRPLQALLNQFGNHANFRLILFTLDESTYARELGPLASYYPAVKLGPPWWFNDNLNGIQRYFEQAIDSGGLYNTVGFNDDTRALLSIPARHDLWRRASASWLAGLLVRHIVDEKTAYEMMEALACGLAVKAYRLEDYVTIKRSI